MSNSALRVLAGAGAKGDPIYVDDVFSNFRYQGNNSTNQIVNGIDLAGEGGLVWQKARSNYTANHLLTDTVRGRTKYLSSNLNSAEATANDTHIASFNNNGFTLGSGYTAYENFSGIADGIMSWTFRKQPGFFDVVTYTGDGTDNRDIAHNLGATVGCLILKRLDYATDWDVYHRGVDASNPQSYKLTLNSNAARSSANTTWGNPEVAPSSTSFRVNNFSNTDGATYVAYLFAHDAQDFGTDSDEAIIKCGSYTGNGSSTGPTIDLGFEPQWLMIKSTGSNSGPWTMIDTLRGAAVGGNDEYFAANENWEEQSFAFLDVTPTGFDIKTNGYYVNASSVDYVYVAIRRPFKPAEEFAATDLFSQSMGLNASAGGKVYATTYPVDFHFAKNNISGTGDWYVKDRLRGGNNYLNTNDPRAESSHAYNNEFDHMDGIYTETALDNTSSLGYQFRRAPGLMDVVAFTGNQTARQINHNLGAVPEMMWVKCRSQTRNWAVYAASQGNTKVANLNSTGAFTADTSSWNNTSPTSTHFTVGDGATTNFNPEPMIAYLFATVAGVSKVGSYTGTGSDLNVDCGFSAGARFVLIKRSDGTGDWYVWDSVRGIVAGNDPYYVMNSNAGGVTNTDYIDPLSSGFTVTSSAPDEINASGGTYLFYAIA